MRQLQGVLLAGAALFALGSSAAASDLTLGFSGVKSGSVEYSADPGPRVTTPILPDPSTGQINGFVNFSGSGGNVEAIVNIASNLVTFESGTATVGANSRSNSRSGIDIRFENIGDGNIKLSPFGSTIIPAGMGFYVQDRTFPATDDNPFTCYGQSETVTFRDFYTPGAAVEIFAHAEFDFDVMAGDTVLYSLNGLVNLSFNVDGTLVVEETLTGPDGAGRFLNGFRTVDDDHHALTYDWQATNIVIPLDEILGPFGIKTVRYRADVTSWTQAACINSGANCIVAFSGFGDPVGRGGFVDDFAVAAFGDIVPFHAADPKRVISGLNFRPVTVSVFHPVPEPATWALMITGFGLAGTALRRHRRVAYTG